MEKKQEVAITGETPIDMIKMAVSGGADLDKVEKLLALQVRWEANEAKKAFNRAMAEFKANPPRIEKDKKVKYLNVKYSHASLANVVEKITTELSKHGLSASWRIEQNGQIKVICQIAHIMGHIEETSLSAGSDPSGSKNSIQAIGSTISYLERYTLLAILGLSAHDQDDDGQNSEEVAKIDENKLKILQGLLVITKSDVPKFLKYMDIEKLEDMPKKSFTKAKIALEEKKKNANN